MSGSEIKKKKRKKEKKASIKYYNKSFPCKGRKN